MSSVFSDTYRRVFRVPDRRIRTSTNSPIGCFDKLKLKQAREPAAGAKSTDSAT